MTSTDLQIGPTIKKIRKKDKLTLKDLAVKTGLSESMLSQIERDKVMPSVSTLRRIGVALNCPLSLFFSNEKRAEGMVVRKGCNKGYYIPESKMTFELLSPDLKGKKMETAIVTLKKGGSTGEMTWHYGEEMTYVIKGSVLFQINEEEYILNEGDSIYYSAKLPHSVKNIGKGKALMFYAACPPNF